VNFSRKAWCNEVIGLPTASECVIILEMADSGQQPTAGSEVDTLVHDIFDMMSNMKIRKIAIGSLELYFNKLLHDLPSLPPEVSAERMRKFKSRLQKTVQAASNAATADKPDRSAPTAAIGHTW
jgi:hypothetical protein